MYFLSLKAKNGIKNHNFSEAAFRRTNLLFPPITAETPSGVDSIVQKAISTIATDNENYPSTDETESYENRQTTTQIDKASLAPIFEELEESKPVKLLSKKEAFKLAKQRGYKSSDAAFAQWFRDHKGGNLYGISKHSGRGKYEDTV